MSRSSASSSSSYNSSDSYSSDDERRRYNKGERGSKRREKERGRDRERESSASVGAKRVKTDNISSNATQELPSNTKNGLTEEQKARVERAKEIARQQSIQHKSSTPASSSITPTLSTSSSSNTATTLQAPPTNSNTPNPAEVQYNRNMTLVSRIYIGNIHFELREDHIRTLFEQFGSIKNLNLSTDAATGKHKGFAFIEYESPESANLALEHTLGTEMNGRTLKVGRPNNFSQAAYDNLPKPIAKRVFISNVNTYVSEEDVASIFESFGKIKECVLLPNIHTRRHKGCGFVEFENPLAASQAVANMNGFELGGSKIFVSKSIVGVELPEGMKAMDKLVLAAGEEVGLNGMNGNMQLDKQSTIIVPANKELALEEGNVHVNAAQRYAIMQKLARKSMVEVSFTLVCVMFAASIIANLTCYLISIAINRSTHRTANNLQNSRSQKHGLHFRNRQLPQTRNHIRMFQIRISRKSPHMAPEHHTNNIA